MDMNHMMEDQIKKHNIKSTPKTHFIKLNNIFSIFIFIFLISFSVSICSYTHHFPNFTDSNDRHYVFVICNGILFFLFMNFNSTHDSSLKQNQPEIDHPPVLVSSAMEEQEEEIEEEDNDDDEMERNGNWVYVNKDHNAVSIIEDRIEDQMAKQHQHVAVVEEQETGESNHNAVSIIEDRIEDQMANQHQHVAVVEEQETGESNHNAVSIIEDRIEDQMVKQHQHVAVGEEQETGESKEAAETEELNKKCAEFIRNMRERMKSESSYRYGFYSNRPKINATISV